MTTFPSGTVSTVRLLLGDQLHREHSWFKTVSNDVLYVLMEVRQETDYCTHHIQKVVAFFLAMRAFAEELRSHGHAVHYITLDDPTNHHSIPQNLIALLSAVRARRFEYQLPDEYRLDRQLKELSASLSVETQAVDSEHFLTSRTELQEHFARKKTYLMESFYRAMRRKYNLLMEDGEPIGGAWNFDAENRKKLPAQLKIPPPLEFTRDVSTITTMIERMRVKTIGSINPTKFIWPTTRAEALRLLEHFCKHQLPLFGTYQDALHTDHRDLFHSRLSFALNTKMLSPLEVVLGAIKTWKKNQKSISLPQIEGFVRQIVGWREYMRGVYWAQMPTFERLNYFNHERPLPQYYWTGKTKMRCMHHAISQSLEWAYAHHIQRLMVTGNFALLAGIHPDEVDAWYLGVYIDAIQWVEVTNTRGMSQYADGGIVGTKPYVASSNYINNMSNYCAGCHYNRDLRYGDRSCPFNSLYWHFYKRNREKLEGNPRIGHAYRVFDRFPQEEREQILAQAESYLRDLNSL